MSLIVAAIGGNALTTRDGLGAPGEWFEALGRSLPAVVDLLARGHRLVLTHARSRRTYMGISWNEPSRFLGDIPRELLAVRDRAEGARARGPALPGRDASLTDEDPWDDFPTYYVDDEGDEDPVFCAGARVRHKIFGVGEIRDGRGRGPDRKLTIVFPSHGTKTIVARYVEKA